MLLQLVFGRRKIGWNAVKNFIHPLPVHAPGTFRNAGPTGCSGDLRRQRRRYDLIHTDVLLLGQFASLSHERIRDVHK